MSAQSDDDERAVRAKLVAMGVGPNGGPTTPQGAAPPPPSTPPPVPKAPKPQKPPRVIPRPRPKPKGPKPLKAQPAPKQRPASQHPAWSPAPRQSLIDAWSRIPPRVKWLAYHLAAAGVGWRLGWVRWASDTAAWLAAGHWTDLSAWVLYGLALVLVGAYRRTRHWWQPIAWAAAVPVSSIVLGVLLYAPTS